MAPIKVSVIGAGMALHTLHYPSIASQPDKFVLHSVVDRSGRGGVKEKCTDSVKVVQSLDEVISDPEVELVVVASPNNTHFEYTTRIIEAGKHVLVEKPMCPTAAEAQKLVDLAEARGVVLSVYQNRRWDSDFLTVRKLLREGLLGDINEFQSSYDRYRPLPPAPTSGQHFSPADGSAQGRQWKETAGEHNDVIYNLGSHIIDQAYVLFGMPERVGCRVWDQRNIGVDEAFLMDLYYPRNNSTGAPPMVTLRASIISALPDQLRFLIKGNRGTYTKRGVDPQGRYISRLARREIALEGEGYGREDEAEWGEVYLAKDLKEDTEWEVQRYPSEDGKWPYLYTNLYEAIRSDRSKLEVKPRQAVEVLQLIELGLRSSKEGRIISVASQ